MTEIIAPSFSHVLRPTLVALSGGRCHGLEQSDPLLILTLHD